MRFYSICALLVFVIAFGLRVPLVDRVYQYSFEPDSESCVEVTRSFYFFFKSPSVENLPQTLSTYPNYSDGSFIASAIVANLVKPLNRAEIIKADLADGNYSLIIFSMRWSGVLFDALAAVIAFLIFLLLTESTILSLVITLLYYVLNQQTLNIDLIRIDHFGLFAANLLMLAALLLFRNSDKGRYYILGGIAAGLVTGTKINFPFYLLALFLVVCILIYEWKISLKNFLLLTFCFLLVTAFMYQRWLIYPENVPRVIRFTFYNGKIWTEFWGIDNYGYYLWSEFFNHGFSFGVAVLIVFGYSSFILGCLVGVIQKDKLKLILCLTFVLQSVALAFSPKIGRYGIILPLWMGIFMSYGINLILQYFETKSGKIIVRSAFAALLLPSFSYAVKDYEILKHQSPQRSESISENRISPYKWIVENITPGSVFAIQHPRVSNPPVFELPYVFEEKFLGCPFLYMDSFMHFPPPDLDSIKANANYIVTSDKETNYHLAMLKRYHADSLLSNKWLQFYSSLDITFKHHDFSSLYDNYGVKSIHVYELKKAPVPPLVVVTKCSSVVNSGIYFNWTVDSLNPFSEYEVQIQIAEDSLFRNVISGSSAGFPSRYRYKGDPSIVGGREWSVVPPKIMQAFIAGKFNSLPHVEDPHGLWMQHWMQMFFKDLLIYMKGSGATFRESVGHFLPPATSKIFISLVNECYNGVCPFLDSKLPDYLQLADLNQDISNKGFDNLYPVTFRYQPSVQLCKGRSYFWRLRLRYEYKIISDWSKVNSVRL